jgi:hypothetical protein
MGSGVVVARAGQMARWLPCPAVHHVLIPRRPPRNPLTLLLMTNKIKYEILIEHHSKLKSEY